MLSTLLLPRHKHLRLSGRLLQMSIQMSFPLPECRSDLYNALHNCCSVDLVALSFALPINISVPKLLKKMPNFYHFIGVMEVVKRSQKSFEELMQTIVKISRRLQERCANSCERGCNSNRQSSSTGRVYLFLWPVFQFWSPFLSIADLEYAMYMTRYNAMRKNSAFLEMNTTGCPKSSWDIWKNHEK